MWLRIIVFKLKLCRTLTFKTLQQTNLTYVCKTILQILHLNVYCHIIYPYSIWGWFTARILNSKCQETGNLQRCFRIRRQVQFKISKKGSCHRRYCIRISSITKVIFRNSLITANVSWEHIMKLRDYRAKCVYRQGSLLNW